MKSELKKLFALSASAAALSIAAPVYAQNAPVADPAADAVDTAGDIVVTARRVEERLQDVPISMTVFDQGELDDRNVTGAADLATYTPSLTANQRFGSNNVSFAIRGFQQDLRTTPSVGVYFADVVAPRGGITGITTGDGGTPGNYFDLENLQVLKGPQGTLFGRNTTGGAVLLVPKKPTDRFEGYVEGSYGNLDMKRLQAVLNVPISDKAAVRVGVDRQKRDGYLKNVSAIGPKRFGDRNYTALRASLRLNLSDTIENVTILSYTDVDEVGTTPTLTGCNPANIPFGTLACDQLARNQATFTSFYNLDNNIPNPHSKVKQWQAINRTSWEASDALSVRNIVSYGEFTNRAQGGVYGDNYVIPAQVGPIPGGAATGGRPIIASSYPATTIGIPGAPFKVLPRADQWTATEELQLIGTGDRLDWQAGFYFERSESLGPSGAQGPAFLECTDAARLLCSDPLGTLIRRPGFGSIALEVATNKAQSVGVYGQAIYKLRDNLKLTGGVRYTWDKVSADLYTATYRFLAPNVATGFCSYASVGPGNTTPITDARQCSLKNSNKTDAPTWVVGLDYNPVENVLVYGKYSRGYRQGSVNPYAAPPLDKYDAEKVDTYEIGLKTSFRGIVRGTFNVSAFWNDFTDQQVGVSVRSSTNAAPSTLSVANAGKSRIKGVEVESTLSPVRGLVFSASYAYLDARVKQITNPAPNAVYDTVTPTVIAGSRLTYTPKHKLTWTGAYTLPVSDSVGKVTVSATYTYSSSITVTAGPPAVGLPEFGIWNANLNWDSVAGLPVDLSLFMVNLTDKKYYAVANPSTALGILANVPAEPRTYGLRLRYRFGG